jgi:cellulose synthase/poly-beta-1,6-N-acetylglucosamine synthase-like glycosyltransferase
MRLSVVIPTYRRPDALPRTLDHLERQSVASGDFEVIVVVDAEDDDPHEVECSIGERRFAVRRRGQILHCNISCCNARSDPWDWENARSDPWENADVWFRQQLGREFLDAWDRL